MDLGQQAALWALTAEHADEVAAGDSQARGGGGSGPSLSGQDGRGVPARARFFLVTGFLACHFHWREISHFSAPVQSQNASSGTFLHRTDKLAVHLGVRVEDLPEILDLSRRTLFVCRGADSAVTSKSWRKLEAAEAAAGIAPETEFQCVSDTLKKGSDAESAGNANETEKGGEGEIAVLLREIAAALKEIARKLPEP